MEPLFLSGGADAAHDVARHFGKAHTERQIPERTLTLYAQKHVKIRIVDFESGHRGYQNLV